MAKFASLDDVLEFQFRKYSEKRGILTPITFSEDVPFEVKRCFYAWNVPNKMIRGQHAHTDCHQVLICMKGMIRVTVKDGTTDRVYILDSPEKALYIPATIWTEEQYDNDAILFVLCSHEYSKDEYVRDWDTFVKWRKDPSHTVESATKRWKNY